MGSEVSLPGLRPGLRSLGLNPGTFSVPQWVGVVSPPLSCFRSELHIIRSACHFLPPCFCGQGLRPLTAHFLTHLRLWASLHLHFLHSSPPSLLVSSTAPPGPWSTSPATSRTPSPGPLSSPHLRDLVFSFCCMSCIVTQTAAQRKNGPEVFLH